MELRRNGYGGIIMKQFRHYQNESLDAVLQAVEDGKDRALVVMATGLGKSVVAARLAQMLWQRYGWKVLWIMHMVEPLEKMRDGHCTEEFEGTDATFGMFTGLERSNVKDADVLFATFDTMLGNLAEFSTDQFQLVIVDECHHAWADTYKTVLDYFTPRLTFGMTATPNRMDGKDIREIFGNELYEFTLAEALADGRWLSTVDYRVMVDDIDKEVLRELLDELEQNKGIRVARKDLDKRVFLEEKLEAQAQRVHEVQSDGNKKTIIFCRNRDHLREVTKHFPKFRPYHSGLKRKTLQKRFKAFECGSLRGLLVIDKFNEAIDVPDAELIVFLRATDSKTVWLQQLGRGLRLAEGKGNVIVLDFVANCDRVLSIQDFTSSVTGNTGGDRSKGSNHPDAASVKTGWNVNFEEEVRDILQLLNYRLGTTFYGSIEEAMEAVQSLDPKPVNVKEYYNVFSQDPQLPSNPNVYYIHDWKRVGGYRGFLGTSPYETIEEAMEAVKLLVPRPKTHSEYRKVYKQDCRLPAAPGLVYADKWHSNGGVKGFLGTTPYETIEEAMEAVKLLQPRPRTGPEYSKVYKQDWHLHAAPEEFYAEDWKRIGGSRGFFGTKPYETVEEAMEAVKLLVPRPKTRRQYLKVYHQDWRLPSAPSSAYADDWERIGKISGFLGTKNYETVEEAMEAVKLLVPRPKKRSEYDKYYKQDWRLPSAPWSVYANDWERIGGIKGFLR